MSILVSLEWPVGLSLDYAASVESCLSSGFQPGKAPAGSVVMEKSCVCVCMGGRNLAMPRGSAPGSCLGNATYHRFQDCLP